MLPPMGFGFLSFYITTVCVIVEHASSYRGLLQSKVYLRDYEVREHIPHTWASSHDNLFQSNFSSKSSCEAILGKTPDWSNIMT